MKQALIKATLFALVPLSLAVLADLLLWVFYQGAQPANLRDEIAVLHGAFFLVIFVLSALGSLLAFLLARRTSIGVRSVLMGALLFALATFFALMPAFAFGGPLGVGAWLFLGAALFAAGTCKWGRRGAAPAG